MRFQAFVALVALASAVSAEEWTVDHPQPVVWTEAHGAFEDALFGNATWTTPLTQPNPSMHKRDDGSVDISVLENELELTSLKYKANTARIRLNAGASANPDTRLARMRRVVIGLQIPQAGTFAATVELGTPAQSFQVYLDTGSADLTLGGQTCSNCGSKAKYNPAASSSSVNTGKTVRSSFVDGTTSTGTAYTDLVNLGRFTAPAQSVIAANTLSTLIANLPVDGIMGLGFRNLQALKQNSTVFSLYGAGMGSYFALRLTDKPNYSYMSLGSIPKTRLQMPMYTYLNYNDQPTATYWQVRLSAPNVNGNVAVSTRATHILDSGTNYIIAPPSAAAEFWSNVPGSQQYNTNYYTFPCANPPNVSITLFRRAVSFAVAPQDFNLGYLPQDPSRCVGSVVALNAGIGSSWILGQAFLKNWLTIYNMADPPAMSIVAARDRGPVPAYSVT